MRKTVTAVAGAAVLTVGLAACGSNGQNSSSASGSHIIHLTMWQQWGGGHEQAALNKIIAEYEKLHPNVRITELPVTNDAKILTAISGGTPPDIIDLGTSLQVGQWASKGALMSLTPYIKKNHVNTSVYVPAGLKAVTYNGQMYGLPFMNFDVGLLYNKALFKAAGLNPNKPPTTTQQLQADAYKLTKVSSNGTIEQLGFLPQYPGQSNGQVTALEMLGWDYGGQWYQNGHVSANDPRNIAALNWEASFYKKFGPQNMANFLHSAGAYLTAKDPFESGKLAMVYDGPWALDYAEANVPQLAKNIGVAPFPAPAGQSSRTGTTFIDTNPQVIPSGAAHPNAAFKFIQWETTNPQVASTFATLVYNLPQLKNVPNFKLASDPRFRVFMQEADSANAHVWPQLPISTEYGVKLDEAQDAVLYGQETAKSALDGLQQTISAALKQSK